MKKVIITIFFIMMILSLTACSAGQISESQIKNDMNEYFAAEKFRVSSVTVERSRRIEKSDTIDVCVDVEGENFSGKRWYILNYNKYSRIGWQLDFCNPVHEEKWTAKTDNPPDCSKEKLAEYIFCKEDVRGGYSLNKNIVRAKFKEWTSGANKDERGPERFIKNVEHRFNESGNVFIAEVTVSAKSKLFQIEETIFFEWYLDMSTYEWQEPYIYSMDGKVINIVDLNGKYLCRNTGSYIYRDDEIRTAEIKSFGQDRKFLYSQSTSKGERTFVIEGLFYSWQYVDSHSKFYITFTDEAFHEGTYGWVVYYDDKI